MDVYVCACVRVFRDGVTLQNVERIRFDFGQGALALAPDDPIPLPANDNAVPYNVVVVLDYRVPLPQPLLPSAHQQQQQQRQVSQRQRPQPFASNGPRLSDNTFESDSERYHTATPAVRAALEGMFAWLRGRVGGRSLHLSAQ